MQQTLTELRVDSSMPKHGACQRTQLYHHSHASRTARPISNRLHATQSTRRMTENACHQIGAKPAPLSMKNRQTHKTDGPTRSAVGPQTRCCKARHQRHATHRRPPGSRRGCSQSRVRKGSRTSAGALPPPFRGAAPEITERESTEKHRQPMPHHATPSQWPHRAADRTAQARTFRHTEQWIAPHRPARSEFPTPISPQGRRSNPQRRRATDPLLHA